MHKKFVDWLAKREK